MIGATATILLAEDILCGRWCKRDRSETQRAVLEARNGAERRMPGTNGSSGRSSGGILRVAGDYGV